MLTGRLAAIVASHQSLKAQVTGEAVDMAAEMLGTTFISHLFFKRHLPIRPLCIGISIPLLTLLSYSF